jgi:hypothetical protein
MKQEVIQIRVSKKEKTEIERKSKELGFSSISEYLRYVGKMCEEVVVKVGREVEENEAKEPNTDS